MIIQYAEARKKKRKKKNEFLKYVGRLVGIVAIWETRKSAHFKIRKPLLLHVACLVFEFPLRAFQTDLPNTYPGKVRLNTGNLVQFGLLLRAGIPQANHNACDYKDSQVCIQGEQMNTFVV